MSGFKKATKQQSKLRAAISGGSGSGKTYTALSIAQHLGARVALVDTEQGSASKYADLFNFDVMEVVGDYHPDRVIQAIKDAAGYDVLIIDSLTHFWNSTNGFLDLVDKRTKAMAAGGKRADSFAAWKDVTPVYNRLVHGILAAPMHVIVTLRAKQEYSKENGKVEKLGVAPEMRDGFQYELDVEGLLDQQHNLVIGKTRCPSLDGQVFTKPGKDLADLLKAWLTDGAPAASRTEPADPIAACTTRGELLRLAAAAKESGTDTEEFKASFKARWAEVV